MKKEKKKLLIGILVGIIIISLIVLYFTSNNSSKNFIKLSYEEFKEKIDNGDSFVLCVSRTTCSHCNDYKPKLLEVSNKYNIMIYYIEINEFSDIELNYFKEIFGFDGSTPITMFIKDGKEGTTGSRIEGDVSKERIVSKLKTNGFIK